eukprot:1204035-Rhodomonas_salina.1
MGLQRHCSFTQLVPDLPQLAQDPWHVLMFQLAMRGLEQRQRLHCMRQRLFELLLLEVSARRQVVSLRHLPAYTVLPAARMLPHCHNARRILEALNWLAVSVDEQQRMVEQRVRGQLPLAAPSPPPPPWPAPPRCRLSSTCPRPPRLSHQAPHTQTAQTRGHAAGSRREGAAPL